MEVCGHSMEVWVQTDELGTQDRTGQAATFV